MRSDGEQILDGVAAGIFGVVSVLVIADLTQATGRFNLTLGAISTGVGLGAALFMPETLIGRPAQRGSQDIGRPAP